MILQALTQYYETLLAKEKISPPGWNDQFSVSFGLELAPDGTLLQLIPYKQTKQQGKKTVEVPRNICVPAHVKRSSGVAANFLCDTASYMLGADTKGKPCRQPRSPPADLSLCGYSRRPRHFELFCRLGPCRRSHPSPLGPALEGDLYQRQSHLLHESRAGHRG